MVRQFFPFLLFLLLSLGAKSQFLTHEDSLSAGLSPSQKSVVLSGYGEIIASYNHNFKTVNSSLKRNVLFVGYKFNKRITFFSEIEIENAKIDGGPQGELSVEQCALKFDLSRNHYLLAGLIIPRIGLLNENHLPVTYNGNDRNDIETLIIPSTWREIGVGYYGMSQLIPGLNWNVALLNGLNASAISGKAGIRDARYEGRNASSSNIAITGSLLYYYNNFRFQLSHYYGGSSGYSPREADSLGLDAGLFGTPVSLSEVNVQYISNRFNLKLLGVYSTIPDAEKLNRAFATNAPLSMYGAYLEVACHLLKVSDTQSKQLLLFSRFEIFDQMNTIPVNGIKDDLYKQHSVVTGLTYLPIRGIAIKLDWKYQQTGKPNDALLFRPSPNAPAYQPVNNFLRLGLAYSF